MNMIDKVKFQCILLNIIIVLCVLEHEVVSIHDDDFINEPRLSNASSTETNDNINLSKIITINLDDPTKNADPPSPIPDVSELCQEILEDLSQKASNFTYCTISNARPITICKDCMVPYYDFLNVYKNISVKNDNDCENELLNRDKLLIIQTLNNYVTNMWNKAQCENCYTHVGNETRLSNDTIEYFDMLNRVNSCINKNKGPLKNEPKNVKDVCEVCRKYYVDLNDKYEQLNTKFNNHVCMDIVDHMNFTHHMWSVEFHCVQPHFLSYPVLIMSGLVGMIPVLFYVINRYASSARENEIVLQKRMSFVQSSSHSNLQRLT